MKITIIGLGKMGLSLAKQLLDQHYNINGYDINTEVRNEIEHTNFTFLKSIDDLSQSTDQKLVLLLLPAGEITHSTLQKLTNLLKPNDILIDFSNSNFKDSIREGQALAKYDIVYHDCGLSGGVTGARNGACMMLGNVEHANEETIRILKGLCVPGGFQAYEGLGSGHYLKMVHNGIEYGMMQAIAEGLELLNEQSHYHFDLSNVTSNWSEGSIIESALLDNIHEELTLDTKLQQFSQKVASSGEAKWMVMEALEEEVPVPVTAMSLMKRNASLREASFSNQAISAMRYNFGGHREY